MEVSPFRGISYNQRIAGDLVQVICPPYDIITPEQQKLYYQESSYNAIRLEFPTESQETTVDHYQRAATTFQQWLKQEILQLDSVASFYLHDHRFAYSGERKTRRGLIARVKLEPWGTAIYPHEETFPKAKGDRLQLMRACQATFSPLLALYHDPEQKIAPVLSGITQEKPLISSKAKRSNLPDSNEAHTLWAITEPEIKQELSQFLSSQPLYIADGHHRYETALTYQQERAKDQPVTGKEAFNYVMLELVDFSDPGLVILPLHRLVRGILPSILGELEDRLKNFFVLESAPLKDDNCQIPTDSCLGILGLQSGSLVLLRKRRDISLDAMMPGNRSRAYRQFDVSILNHIILEKIMDLTLRDNIAYTVDLKEAHQQIKDG
ncbi:MAG: DUF1015 domain-containing protein, partial [Chloroflexota bacterium]